MIPSDNYEGPPVSVISVGGMRDSPPTDTGIYPSSYIPLYDHYTNRLSDGNTLTQDNEVVLDTVSRIEQIERQLIQCRQHSNRNTQLGSTPIHSTNVSTIGPSSADMETFVAAPVIVTTIKDSNSNPTQTIRVAVSPSRRAKDVTVGKPLSDDTKDTKESIPTSGNGSIKAVDTSYDRSINIRFDVNMSPSNGAVGNMKHMSSNKDVEKRLSNVEQLLISSIVPLGSDSSKSKIVTSAKEDGNNNKRYTTVGHIPVRLPISQDYILSQNRDLNVTHSPYRRHSPYKDSYNSGSNSDSRGDSIMHALASFIADTRAAREAVLRTNSSQSFSTSERNSPLHERNPTVKSSSKNVRHSPERVKHSRKLVHSDGVELHDENFPPSAAPYNPSATAPYSALTTTPYSAPATNALLTTALVDISEVMTKLDRIERQTSLTTALYSAPTTAPYSTPTTAPYSAPATAPYSAPATASYSTSAPHSTPTTAPHSAPTTAPYSAPTAAPYSAPTASYSAPTASYSTSATASYSTSATHSAPTTAPYSAPTTAQYSAPTTAPYSTSAPHSAPTTAQYSAPTTAPYSAPTASYSTSAPHSAPTAQYSAPTIAPYSTPTTVPYSAPTTAQYSTPVTSALLTTALVDMTEVMTKLDRIERQTSPYKHSEEFDSRSHILSNRPTAQSAIGPLSSRFSSPGEKYNNHAATVRYLQGAMTSHNAISSQLLNNAWIRRREILADALSSFDMYPNSVQERQNVSRLSLMNETLNTDTVSDHMSHETVRPLVDKSCSHTDDDSIRIDDKKIKELSQSPKRLVTSNSDVTNASFFAGEGDVVGRRLAEVLHEQRILTERMKRDYSHLIDEDLRYKQYMMTREERDAYEEKLKLKADIADEMIKTQERERQAYARKQLLSLEKREREEQRHSEEKQREELQHLMSNCVKTVKQTTVRELFTDGMRGVMEYKPIEELDVSETTSPLKLPPNPIPYGRLSSALSSAAQHLATSHISADASAANFEGASATSGEMENANRYTPIHTHTNTTAVNNERDYFAHTAHQRKEGVLKDKHGHPHLPESKQQTKEELSEARKRRKAIDHRVINRDIPTHLTQGFAAAAPKAVRAKGRSEYISNQGVGHSHHKTRNLYDHVEGDSYIVREDKGAEMKKRFPSPRGSSFATGKVDWIRLCSRNPAFVTPLSPVLENKRIKRMDELVRTTMQKYLEESQNVDESNTTHGGSVSLSHSTSGRSGHNTSCMVLSSSNRLSRDSSQSGGRTLHSRVSEAADGRHSSLSRSGSVVRRVHSDKRRAKSTDSSRINKGHAEKNRNRSTIITKKKMAKNNEDTTSILSSGRTNCAKSPSSHSTSITTGNITLLQNYIKKQYEIPTTSSLERAGLKYQVEFIAKRRIEQERELNAVSPICSPISRIRSSRNNSGEADIFSSPPSTIRASLPRSAHCEITPFRPVSPPPFVTELSAIQHRSELQSVLAAMPPPSILSAKVVYPNQRPHSARHVSSPFRGNNETPNRSTRAAHHSIESGERRTTTPHLSGLRHRKCAHEACEYLGLR